MTHNHDYKWILRQEGASDLHLQKTYQLLWQLAQQNSPIAKESSD